MTEAEWLTLHDSRAMLDLLRPIATCRKLRLFGSACARLAWQLVSDPRLQVAVESTEKYADGLIDKDDLRLARAEVDVIWWRTYRRNNHSVSSRQTAEAVRFLASATDRVQELHHRISLGVQTLAGVGAGAPGPSEQASVLRDIFGNPFRPVTFDPRWRTEDVLGLARGIYDERAFDRLPLLADALMDAGCDSDDVLSHCRSEGPHVRGCWVVDLVLGKE